MLGTFKGLAISEWTTKFLNVPGADIPKSEKQLDVLRRSVWLHRR